jgi:AcrR family transcriptional regulator
MPTQTWPEEKGSPEPPRRKRGVAKGPARDAQRTRANIIAVATAEFAEFGLAGARMDRIARRTRTSKRMLYYYFGDKSGLYQAVLLSYYEKLRCAEQALDLKRKPPLLALRMLVEFAFDFHREYADVARLVMVENINKGRHMPKRAAVAPEDAAALESVNDILRRGEREGVMRDGLNALHLYATIIALCFFNVSNRYTFRAVFRHDMHTGKEAAARRRVVWETVRRNVLV